MPGDKTAGAFTGLLGAGDTIGAATHVLTSTEASVIGAVGMAVVGVYLWCKSGLEGWQERKKRNADRHEN